MVYYICKNKIKTMKKKWIFLTIIIVFVVAIFIIMSIKNNRVNGQITNIDAENRIVTIQDQDQEIALKLNNKTKMFDIRNHPCLFSDFNIGFDVTAKMKEENGNLNVDWIRIKKSPNIVILTPEDKAIVRNMIKVEGVARVFENTLQIEIKDKKDKKVIYSKTVMANPIDIGLFGPFEAIIDLSKYADLKNIELSAFQYSAKDGSVIDKTTINLDVIK